MRKADMPPAPRRGHGSSRQMLKQRLDRTPGMRLFHEEEQGPETVLHRTSSAARNFCGSLSGLRQLASKSSRSWLIRDSSVPADLNGLDTESNASSFGSMSGFGSRFGSAVDLAGLIGLEDLAVSGTPREVGSQGSNFIFLRSQLEIGNRRDSLEGSYTPRHCDGGEHAYEQRDDDIGTEQFALEGVALSPGLPDEAPMQSNNATDEGSSRASPQGDEVSKPGVRSVDERCRAVLRTVADADKTNTLSILTGGPEERDMVARPLDFQIIDGRLAAGFYGGSVDVFAEDVRQIWRNAESLQKGTEVTELACNLSRLFEDLLQKQVLNFKSGIPEVESEEPNPDLADVLEEGIELIIAPPTRSATAEKNAAIKIQSAFRASRIRSSIRARKFAVVTIQRFFRGYYARKSYLEMKNRALELQALARSIRTKKLYQKLFNTVVMIQKLWLTVRSRKIKEHTTAATRIQSLYRGWLARRVFIEKLRSIILIQALERRRKAQKRYKNMRNSALLLQRTRRSSVLQRLKLQVAMEELKALQKLRNQQRLQERSAVMIQAAYRGWAARKSYERVVASVVRLQACIRRKQLLESFRRFRSAVCLIQGAWRLCRSRLQRDNQSRCAIKIQRVFRGWMTRREFRREVALVVIMQSWVRRTLLMKEYRELRTSTLTTQRVLRSYHTHQSQLRSVQECASICIQAHYRGYIARRVYTAEVARVITIQALFRRKRAVFFFRKACQAVLTIQQAWRAHKSRQLQLHNEAAVRVQTVYRGHLCRNNYRSDVAKVVWLQACIRRQQAQKRYRELLQVQHEAALIVQTFFRGWSTRKKVRLDLQRVVLLQACARRMLIRKRYQMMLRAASTIQRAWRTFKDNQRHVQEELEIVASVKIQSYYKGWKYRKLFKTMLSRVVYTQACIRRTLATKHYEELRRVVIVLQRRWRQHKQLRFNVTVKIQTRWRGYKQRQLYQSLLQRRIVCATRIQRGWRGTVILQNLRLERWSRERAVIRIQAHFRGKIVRMWLTRRQHAVICIEYAYWSYKQRRHSKLVMPVERQRHVCEQSAEPCVVGACLVDDNFLRGNFLREATLRDSNGSLDTFSPKSPLSVANSCVHINSSETLVSDCGYISSQCSASLMEDWNNVTIDELDQCLDTCLAALPLSAASSRQRSLASSRQCSSTFDAVSSSSCLDHLDTAISAGSGIERTASSGSLKKSEVQQDFVVADEVYGSTASEAIQPGSETKSSPQQLYPSPSRQLPIGEESAILLEQGEKSHGKSSASKDKERLQHFAEIFLTMRQISIQQQRAQSAPPFPPSLAPLSSPTPPQSPPTSEVVASVVEASPPRRSRNRYASVPLPPTPAVSNNQPQVSSQRADVVLNMEELLKTLEQYCDEDSDMVIEGDVESGPNWRVRKTGLNLTSTPTLGIKHLKLPDVNAVLIVLVAMVVYTRTVCREVFFGTRQSHRKN